MLLYSVKTCQKKYPVVSRVTSSFMESLRHLLHNSLYTIFILYHVNDYLMRHITRLKLNGKSVFTIEMFWACGIDRNSFHFRINVESFRHYDIQANCSESSLDPQPSNKFCS
jgi:hypothetical protein